jgi:hypothetical protein
MAAARGDRKPCTHARCAGIMQFGREMPLASTPMGAEGQRGWVCSEEPGHFLLDSPRNQPAQAPAADACWDERRSDLTGT